MMYLLPRTDNYLSVSPNILNSLNINTESNRRHKSTFKDPNASEKWNFHHEHSDTSYRDDDGGHGYIQYDADAQTGSPEFDDQASAVSYTTLMFNHQQKKLAKSAPKTRGWLSYFTPSSSANNLEDRSNNDMDDLLIDVPENDAVKKSKKAPRIKKERYRSQAGPSTDNMSEQSHSIRSMFSDK